MFNAPRPAQRYVGTPNTAGFGGSFVDENPLSSSVFDDGLDPWSAAPSPTPTPMPQAPSSVFSSVIADATVPTIYHTSFAAVDPENTGETSVNSLSRVLATSSLPAATIDKIVNLVSSRSRVSKLEFFVALALVALAQAGKDVSIEQVAALSLRNTLPEPTLDLSRLQPSTSTFAPQGYQQSTRQNIRSPAPPYDPWQFGAPANNGFDNARGSLTNGVPSNLAGSGLPKDWWRKQETVKVNILGMQGFILNRYMVYEIMTDRGAPVHRRYSEFAFLWDCLARRYPFRLFPALPPKRIGPDEHFLEQRRKGLARALSFVINHPILKDDGLLAVFLTEPSLENWRKQSSISLDEESVSKRVDRVEEMTIPSDLEDKLEIIRGKLNPLIEQWQRICILAERIIKRREAAAGDLARLTNTLRAVIEVNQPCWRGDECELSNGVRLGLEQVAAHTQRHSELSELRTRALFDTTLEALKGQRDLYLATRDLFIRHERLAIDQVERLKKRVETNSVKLDGIRTAQKDGWEDEVEKYTSLIEKDQASIAAQLSRRVFIRASMWHELRVMLHNRENTLLTQTVQKFAREEQAFAESVVNNWGSLVEAVEGMPFE